MLKHLRTKCERKNKMATKYISFLDASNKPPVFAVVEVIMRLKVVLRYTFKGCCTRRTELLFSRSDAFSLLLSVRSVLTLLQLCFSSRSSPVNGSWGWRTSREPRLLGTLMCHRSRVTPGDPLCRLSLLLLTLLDLQALRHGRL